ncbi:MAG: crotonase/enoyl-CoA hydratase family protein [Methylocystaceae bacterium]|nr:crotonase/enoyl-CoA hydratase family protein [Methylocystaceae bacterium]
MSTAVSYEIHGDVCVITMDDGKVNAFSFDMVKQVNDVLDAVEKTAKAIVLTGRKDKFCGGFDLKTMQAGGEGKERLLLEGFQLSYRLLNMPVPVILACNGHALAYGGILLLSCDYRIGQQGSYKLGLNEIAIGVEMPTFGIDLAKSRLSVAYQIPAVANSVLYDPNEAKLAGFLDAVVDGTDVVETAIKAATDLAQIDLNAHAKAKRDLRSDFLKKHKAVYGC